MAFAAGQRLTAQVLNSTFPESVSNTQGTAGTFTSLTYVETMSGGTACGVVFVAPASGKVMVFNTTSLDNSIATGRTLCSFIIRNGGTIGSGTTFLDPADAGAVVSLGADDLTSSRAYPVTGLAPGATYNIRQQFRVNVASTGTTSQKNLSVVPVV